MTEPEFEYADVELCPGGPLLLHGEHVVRDAEGRVHHAGPPLSAVCRCGQSASAPWCDGTHKLLPADKRP
jgi:CDGSH-type Zn-finger protein